MSANFLRVQSAQQLANVGMAVAERRMGTRLALQGAVKHLVTAVAVMAIVGAARIPFQADGANFSANAFSVVREFGRTTFPVAIQNGPSVRVHKADDTTGGYWPAGLNEATVFWVSGDSKRHASGRKSVCHALHRKEFFFRNRKLHYW